MNKHKWAKEIVAFANGEKVEYYAERQWQPVPHLGAFDLWHCQFRIAPKETYALFFSSDNQTFLGATTYSDYAKAKEDAAKTYRSGGPAGVVVKLVPTDEPSQD